MKGALREKEREVKGEKDRKSKELVMGGGGFKSDQSTLSVKRQQTRGDVRQANF